MPDAGNALGSLGYLPNNPEYQHYNHKVRESRRAKSELVTQPVFLNAFNQPSSCLVMKHSMEEKDVTSSASVFVCVELAARNFARCLDALDPSSPRILAELVESAWSIKAKQNTIIRSLDKAENRIDHQIGPVLLFIKVHNQWWYV